MNEWDEVEEKTGVPRLWGVACFERESSSDCACSPAQGDLWRKISRHVPKGGRAQLSCLRSALRNLANEYVSVDCGRSGYEHDIIWFLHHP
jgi:hypothetical protein